MPTGNGRESTWLRVRMGKHSTPREISQNIRYAASMSRSSTGGAQPLSGPARRLSCRMLSEFFAQPLVPDRLALKLVVDNDRSKTAP
jgi:hypothetical protein